MTTDENRIYYNANSTKYYIRDPIDGGRVLRNDTRDMLFNWCEENCKGRYWIGMGFGQFEINSDAVMFVLKWG